MNGEWQTNIQTIFIITSITLALQKKFLILTNLYLVAFGKAHDFLTYLLRKTLARARLGILANLFMCLFSHLWWWIKHYWWATWVYRFTFQTESRGESMMEDVRKTFQDHKHILWILCILCTWWKKKMKDYLMIRWSEEEGHGQKHPDIPPDHKIYTFVT